LPLQQICHFLIDIKNPQQGEWNLQADVDPDNRILIVTNLRLAVDKLPTNLMLGDRFEARARIQEKGKTLTRGDLLSLLQFEASLTAADTMVEKQDLRQTIIDVRAAARHGQKFNISEKLLKSGLLSQESDRQLRQLVKSMTPPEEKLVECPNCFGSIPVSSTTCRFCDHNLGDMRNFSICPKCKHKQSVGEKLCGACGADIATGLRPREYPERSKAPQSERDKARRPVGRSGSQRPGDARDGHHDGPGDHHSKKDHPPRLIQRESSCEV